LGVHFLPFDNCDIKAGDAELVDTYGANAIASFGVKGHSLAMYPAVVISMIFYYMK